MPTITITVMRDDGKGAFAEHELTDDELDLPIEALVEQFVKPLALHARNEALEAK